MADFYSPTEEGWLKKAKALDEQLVRQQDLKVIDLHTSPDVLLHADQITLDEDIKVGFLCRPLLTTACLLRSMSSGLCLRLTACQTLVMYLCCNKPYSESSHLLLDIRVKRP